MHTCTLPAHTQVDRVTVEDGEVWTGDVLREKSHKLIQSRCV